MLYLVLFSILAPALSVFLVKVIYGKGQTDSIRQSFGKFSFPGLSKIPVIGDLFFKNTSLMGYLAILTAFIAWFVLYKTRFGLRLRSVGEHPQVSGYTRYQCLQDAFCRRYDCRIPWRYWWCGECPICKYQLFSNHHCWFRLHCSGCSYLW